MPKTSGHTASARPGRALPGPSGHVIERIRWVECIKLAGVDRWDLDRPGRCIYDWPLQLGRCWCTVPALHQRSVGRSL